MKKKRRPIPIRATTDNKNIVLRRWYPSRYTYLWLGIQTPYLVGHYTGWKQFEGDVI